MSSELQRAMQTVEDCVKRYGDEVDWVEWQRLKARLQSAEAPRPAYDDHSDVYGYGGRRGRR